MAEPKGSVQTPVILSEEGPRHLKEKFNALQERVDRLEAEMEILREQHRLVVQRTTLGFLDQFYAKSGVALIVPRARTFAFRTDTGFGAFVGVGHYIGRHHVLDLSLDWDLYPALTLRYRFEFHSDNPALTWGPVVGFKTKAADIKPFDNYLDSPSSVRSSFWLFGAFVGFPMGRCMVATELLYLTNSQAFLFLNIGVHVFL